MFGNLNNNDKKRLQELLLLVSPKGTVVRIKDNGTVVFRKTNSFFAKLFGRVECDFLDIVKVISNHIFEDTKGKPIAKFANHQLNKLFEEFCNGGGKAEAIKALYILYLYGSYPPNVKFKVGKDARVWDLSTELLTYTMYDDGQIVEERTPVQPVFESLDLVNLLNKRGTQLHIS